MITTSLLVLIAALISPSTDDGFMAGETVEYQQEVYRLSRIVWSVFIGWIFFVGSVIIIFVIASISRG